MRARCCHAEPTPPTPRPLSGSRRWLRRSPRAAGRAARAGIASSGLDCLRPPPLLRRSRASTRPLSSSPSRQRKAAPAATHRPGSRPSLKRLLHRSKPAGRRRLSPRVCSTSRSLPRPQPRPAAGGASVSAAAVVLAAVLSRPRLSRRALFSASNRKASSPRSMCHLISSPLRPRRRPCARPRSRPKTPAPCTPGPTTIRRQQPRTYPGRGSLPECAERASEAAVSSDCTTSCRA